MRKIVLVFACLVVFPIAAANADVLARISVSAQRMTVYVDGVPRYSWPVSTARAPYATPRGSFRPVRLERKWYSRVYNNAPMPYAIFFHYGFAVHGTYETRSLGRPASHGCVRLPTSAARELFELVREHGMSNSRIVVGI
jgi:lipoprotein-anchoring transpeptidase ErfK/SrfK